MIQGQMIANLSGILQICGCGIASNGLRTGYLLNTEPETLNPDPETLVVPLRAGQGCTQDAHACEVQKKGQTKSGQPVPAAV